MCKKCKCTVKCLALFFQQSFLFFKMFQREIDFFQRLESHRTDAFSKFEDDFYGESIKTLSDYRQWVRQMQRKKREEEKYGKTLVQNKENEAT